MMTSGSASSNACQSSQCRMLTRAADFIHRKNFSDDLFDFRIYFEACSVQFDTWACAHGKCLDSGRIITFVGATDQSFPMPQRGDDLCGARQ